MEYLAEQLSNFNFLAALVAAIIAYAVMRHLKPFGSG